MDDLKQRYLKLLSESYASEMSARMASARLEAGLSLPKGTELYVSDVHGEFDSFSYMLRSASGTIRKTIDALFGDSLDDSEKSDLVVLVSFPDLRMGYALAGLSREESDAWLATRLERLMLVCVAYSRKHRSEHVLTAMPDASRTILGEMLFACRKDPDGSDPHYRALLEASAASGTLRQLVFDVCVTIRRLSIDRVHLVGDVYDRGPSPDAIMDMLEEVPSMDIQWGNHDIVWIGAAIGQRGCIAHVIRNCARYGNLDILEEAYGINLLPLASFALETYADDPCVAFGLKGSPDLTPEQEEINVKIQKAMAVIQFKVEAQLIDAHPEYGLDDRKLLHLIDYDARTVEVDGKSYELVDTRFPTVDRDDPYRLSDAEEAVMDSLVRTFKESPRLQRHVRVLVEKGSMYGIQNGMLMIHACVPLNEDGTLKEVTLDGRSYKGKELYDTVGERIVRAYLDADSDTVGSDADMLWYLWLGPGSPLFAKSKMATFELYLIADKAARKEVKNSFYSLLDDDEVIDRILEDFGMDPSTSRIVCGHVPVKVKDGEDPIRCGGRVLMIDGGYSQAYQSTTGIAGITLVYDENGIVLAEHEPLASLEDAIRDGIEMSSRFVRVTDPAKPVTVAETDEGDRMRQKMEDLSDLIEMYRLDHLAVRPSAEPILMKWSKREASSI